MDITVVWDMPTEFIDATLVRGDGNTDTHFETFGADLRFIEAVNERWPGHVWTDVDGADVSGMAYVNRLCYRIAEHPVRAGWSVTAVYRIDCPELHGDADEFECDRCDGAGDTMDFEISEVENVDLDPQRAFVLTDERAIDLSELRRLWLAHSNPPEG